MQRWMIKILVGVVCITFIGCKTSTSSFNENFEEQEEIAKTTPFGKYPKEVVYTLGKMTGANNSNMPKGDTYEDNAYTRYLKEKLNVQNVDVFEKSTDYDKTVSMAITLGDLPDIMVVSDMEQLQTLIEEDMIEDLTDAYQKCTSERIKKIYASYGDEIFENVMVDGRIMALPETNIENGPSLIWLRKDWMDKLNLKEPKTFEDVERIINEFVTKDPGHNGKGNTVGLICDANIVGDAGYNFEYQMDIIFASYGAFPKQFIRDKNGKLSYGSVQPEAKQALKKLREMYQNGTLDNKFFLYSTENIIKLISEGRCGSFFGPWWAPNNPLVSAKRANKDADWEPYLIQTDKDGSTSYASQNPSYKYVVVRKGYEHPEIVMKIISVLFDYARFQDNDALELGMYFKFNVDPTARPIAINVDFSNALRRCYNQIVDVLDGRCNTNSLGQLEQSYYSACKDYLKDKENATLEDWAAYTSRIKACGVIKKGKTKKVKSLFFGKTKTMKQEWWKLEKLEEDMYLKIISGEVPIDEFDRFTRTWKKQGGDQILAEVNAIISK